MGYLDGFLIAIPKKNLKAYAALSQKMGKVWRGLGALDYRECAGEDLKIKGVNSFLKLLKCKKGETAVFAYILYKSRADRDRINKAVMKDPRVMESCRIDEMPFEIKRMWMGGFETIVKV
jgi:uncharacterized protein YbaA (DUF1428 family)